LALIKFFDLVGFKEIFHFAYQALAVSPSWATIHDGGHFDATVYWIQPDLAFCLCSDRPDAVRLLQTTRLPAASTFWRYVDSLGINQANSILKLNGILRERLWQLCGLQYHRVRVNIDTTVKTVYGHQQGAAKGTTPSIGVSLGCDASGFHRRNPRVSGR